MSNLTRMDYDNLSSRKRFAFKKIAEQLGPQHPISKMMGTRAWGRHKFEQGPEGTLRSAIYECASLDGAYDVLNTWARDNDQLAQRVMANLYPTAFTITAGTPP